ncbi:very short patch repair endonuclease [Actinophytocola sp. NPDC049390]|uniref:very short patch repair endonuclease n=1 Tax=Actinophytocola sp. NPDC049390 TaxID=3363894 RepID=UPI003788DE47
MEHLETTAAVRKRMSRQRSRDTGIEVALRKALYAQGFRYRIHRRPVKDIRRVADIVFSSARVAVFVDGCFWHGCPEHGTWPKSNADFWRKKIETNQHRDADTDRRLSKAGWVSVRIWEHETIDAATAKICETVTSRRAS